MLLTLIAAVVLAALVLPRQEAILKEAILVEAILVEAETPPTPAESGATTPSLETPAASPHGPTRHVHRHLQLAVGDGDGADDRAAGVHYGGVSTPLSPARALERSSTTPSQVMETPARTWADAPTAPGRTAANPEGTAVRA